MPQHKTPQEIVEASIIAQENAFIQNLKTLEKNYKLHLELLEVEKTSTINKLAGVTLALEMIKNGEPKPKSTNPYLD